MNFKAEVSEMVDATLKKMSHLFLIDLTTSADKSIKIVLDGDPEVHLEDCMKFSRSIEHQLDPEKHDFAIEVSSAGVGNPLKQKRQFFKNIGRQLEVEAIGEKPINGVLVEATENQIALEWKQREPKPIGKGKITVTKKKIFSYDNINRAKVII